MSKMLVDSSFLYPLFEENNRRHEAVITIAELYSAQMIVPYVVLTETAFLFRRAGGVPAVMGFIQALIASRVQFEIVTVDDLNRASEIMAAYPEAELDFVDCCIMALSERLNITEVCTLDRRDFSIFRPRHCAYLEILP